MKKLLTLIAMVMTMSPIFASETGPTLCKIEYSETDKKGNTVFSLETIYNSKFGTHVIRMVSDKLSGAVALTSDELQDVINMIDDVKGMKLKAINPNPKKNDKSQWNLYVFASTDSTYKRCKAEGSMGYKPAEDADNYAKCMAYINKLKAFFKDKIVAYQTKHPQPTVVLYEFKENANGLSGILLDQDGRIVDQTYYLCFADDGRQQKAMQIVREKKKEVTFEEGFSAQLMKGIQFVKYEEPREIPFLTDAGAIAYGAVFSDGKMVFCHEHFVTPCMQWEGKKIGVDGLYSIKGQVEDALAK